MFERYIKNYSITFQGGDPDLSTAAKMVLNDFQRGKIPYFVRPPGSEVHVYSESYQQFFYNNNNGEAELDISSFRLVPDKTLQKVSTVNLCKTATQK